MRRVFLCSHILLLFFTQKSINIEDELMWIFPRLSNSTLSSELFVKAMKLEKRKSTWTNGFWHELMEILFVRSREMIGWEQERHRALSNQMKIPISFHFPNDRDATIINVDPSMEKVLSGAAAEFLRYGPNMCDWSRAEMIWVHGWKLRVSRKISIRCLRILKMIREARLLHQRGVKITQNSFLDASGDGRHDWKRMLLARRRNEIQYWNHSTQQNLLRNSTLMAAFL